MHATKPEWISVEMSAKETPDEAARAAGGCRRKRLVRAAAAACVGALALSGLIAASGGASGPRVRASPLAATRAPSPMIPARLRGHHITRATIALFTVTPAQIPASGGTVRLTASVQGATSCRFSAAASVSVGHLPAVRNCASGTISVRVTLPSNSAGAARHFRFSLTATGLHSRTTAGPVLVTENAAVSAHAAPQVTTQPTGRTVAAGASVTFAAAATGASGVRWQVSADGGRSWSAVPGAHAASYTFTAAAADDGDQYRAVFSNSHGTTRTHAATLTVARGAAPALIAPAVTLQPLSENVTAGAGVTFSAGASGSPAPTARWQLSSDGGTSWSDIPGATTTNYTVTAQLGQSGYQYRAIFTNAAGSAATSPATLTVSAATQAPAVTLQPQDQSAVAGTSVSFTAAAAGSPAPSVQWMVSANGGATWAPLAGATATTLTFTAQIGQNGNRYEAVFTNSAGTVTTSAAILTVALTPQAPQILTQPQSVTVTAGANATFSASAAGPPQPSVQWWRSTDNGFTWTQIAGATSTTYTVASTQGMNGYEFKAVFSNGVPPDATTSPATLTVQTAPQITQQPAGTSVVANNTASFTAAASGTPAPTVQWQFSTNGGTSWTPVASGGTSATYSFTAQQSQNGYQYRAVFSNGAGSATTAAAALTVVASAVAPQITTQPSNRAVPSGVGVTLSAAATGSPTPTVQWDVSTDGGATYGPVSGATSTSYSFTATAGMNGYRYEAVFTNAAGTATTNPATLVVGGDDSSTNWAGYYATGQNGSFTMATGSWSVPAVTCSGGATTYSSAWVGIDGATQGNNTVEQDGTESDCSGGVASYSAWYELYGDNADASLNNGSEVPLPNPVYPGDTMTSTISFAAGTWTLALADLTPGHTWSVAEHLTWNSSSSASPKQASAEWIIERPTVCPPCDSNNPSSLSNFGTIAFSGISATKSGTTSTLTGLSARPMQMTGGSGTTLLALPGAATGGGTGFSATYYASN